MRRVTITVNRLVKDTGIVQLDLFTDVSKLEKEKNLQDAMASIKHRFGKKQSLKAQTFSKVR